MNHLIILQGLPGLGKSTQAARLQAMNAYIISSDAIRKELTGDEADQSRNGEVFMTMFARCSMAIGAGQSIIVIDATNTRRQEVDRWVSLGQESEFEVTIVQWPNDLDLALRRNHQRHANGERFVPDEILVTMSTNLASFDMIGLKNVIVIEADLFFERLEPAIVFLDELDSRK